MTVQQKKPHIKLMKTLTGKYLGFPDFDISLTLVLSSCLLQYCMNYAPLSNEEIESLSYIIYWTDSFFVNIQLAIRSACCLDVISIWSDISSA